MIKMLTHSSPSLFAGLYNFLRPDSREFEDLVKILSSFYLDSSSRATFSYSKARLVYNELLEKEVGRGLPAPLNVNTSISAAPSFYSCKVFSCLRSAKLHSLLESCISVLRPCELQTCCVSLTFYAHRVPVHREAPRDEAGGADGTRDD